MSIGVPNTVVVVMNDSVPTSVLESQRDDDTEVRHIGRVVIPARG